MPYSLSSANVVAVSANSKSYLVDKMYPGVDVIQCWNVWSYLVIVFCMSWLLNEVMEWSD
jgi:hypothetical protein